MRLKPSGHYMYRTVVTICTVQWSLYVPHSGHNIYRTVVTICTVQWSLYVPHSGHNMYRTVVTICTAQWSLYVPHSGHYMYRTVVTVCTAQWSLYIPHSGHYMYAQWSLYVPHSGHYMYRTVVTIGTTSLTFSSSTFCPHSVFMCFVWISEQTAIISLYNINRLVFITETECVYCAVRTGYIIILNVRHPIMLFITINSSCHRQHKFSNNINLSHYYGKMFRPNTAIFRKLTSLKPKNIFSKHSYFIF